MQDTTDLISLKDNLLHLMDRRVHSNLGSCAVVGKPVSRVLFSQFVSDLSLFHLAEWLGSFCNQAIGIVQK